MNFLQIFKFNCDLQTLTFIEALCYEYDIALYFYRREEHNYSRLHIPLSICSLSKQDIFQLYRFCMSVVFLNVCSFLPLF